MKTRWLFPGFAIAIAIAIAASLRPEPPAKAAIPVPAPVATGAPATIGTTAGSGPDRGAQQIVSSAESAVSTSEELAALRGQLADETRARRDLERRLALLERRLTGFDDGSQAAQALAGEGDGGLSADFPPAGEEADWFKQQALIDSGMAESQAYELKLFFEKIELERLRIRNLSAREDWERSRTRDELRALEDSEDALRERLGDAGFDAYLYAAGRPNRVAVASVLESAPAGQAGIRAGDYILRYDGQRIYDGSGLRAATRAGSLSDLVEVEVERDGDSLRFFIARGPLGIRTDSISRAP